jgi:hypothetical protein
MKFADRFLVVKIMRTFLIAVAHLHQIIRELARPGTAVSKVGLEIAPVAAHCFTQFCEFLERFENVL